MDIWAETVIQTPLSNSPLLPLLLLSLARQETTPHSAQWINSEYDYIIVGGGTAGSVVASRLSEVPCVTVLVLEAGPEPPILTEVPGLAKYLRGSIVDWAYKTTPQKYTAFSHKNGAVDMPLGKMLGGSSNMNMMTYVRGNRKNYDDWETQGARDWSFNDVFPYFLKLENFTDVRYLNGYHAVGGPITVESIRYTPEMEILINMAVTELGYQFVDINAERQTGFYTLQHNLRDAQRCSAAKGYLVPAKDRPNLHILLNSHVTQVIIENGRATGVVFEHKDQFRVVKARKEIIMSAGAANTPKLLMLSGIGPREELNKWKILVNADVPVGKNLQDHGGSPYYFTVNPEFGIDRKLSDISTIAEYINNRSGPLSSALTLMAAFVNGLNIAPIIDFPNVNLYIFEKTIPTEDNANLKPEAYQKLFGQLGDDRPVFLCLSAPLQQKSKGTVTLKSLNPFDPPEIDTNYLEDSRDLDDIVDGLKLCKMLMDTEPFQQMGPKPLAPVPGCEMFVAFDDAYFRCYVRHIFDTEFHLVGTCKMGDPADPTTVVDPELRVKGIEGLRVVDASVMPIIPSGNTGTPTIMVAEKASDIIKKSIICRNDYVL